MRKTKIICTIGPATNTVEKLVKLIECGMNCARFNFSHGTHESQKVTMDDLKEARRITGTEIPILLDTKGPEIRLKNFVGDKVTLVDGQEFTFDDQEDVLGDETRGAITYHELAHALKPGDTILVDDGKLEMKVISTEGNSVKTKVVHGGPVSNHKSLNIPNVAIPMPFLSEQDKSDLLFGIEQGVDFVAASFTRTRKDVEELRSFLDENGGSGIEIICKIENTQGVENYEDILQVADGLMVARGDLGVEIHYKDIPAIQKRMIDTCNKYGKIAVVATQMLESMTNSPRPTRAEISDVANAIFDGTTAVMLSGESANGKYPFEAVLAMSEIAESAEESNISKRKPSDYHIDIDITQTVCKAAFEAAEYVNAKAILVLSTSGHTAKAISMYHPSVPVIALVAEEEGCHQCSVYYDVYPHKVEKKNTPEEVVSMAKKIVSERNFVKKGDVVVLVAGTSFSYGHTDMVQLYEVE